MDKKKEQQIERELREAREDFDQIIEELSTGEYRKPVHVFRTTKKGGKAHK